MKLFLYTILTFTIFTMTACAPKQAMIKVDNLVSHGDYKNAAEFSNSKVDKKDFYNKNNLLWSLQSGSAYLFANDNNRSIKAFDNSEVLIKYHREQILLKDISQTLKSTLLNDNTRPYSGTEYDGVMANTYKAINYMALEDTSGARVEFNRAIDRQRRAKIFFREMIQKEQDAIQKKEQESLQNGENLNVENSTIDEKLLQKYPTLHDYKPYPDFINPTTTYLAGIFARGDGDEQKAYSLLKEAFAMMPNNKDVQADFEGKKSKQTVWLIFENGQAPVLKEWRIDFPIWIFTNRLSYISVALPKLIERQIAYTYLNIISDRNRTIQTKFLASMDRVIKTEFAKSYKGTVRRAILSAATKTAINYAVQEAANNNNSGIAAFVSVASAIYQVASTQADTRMWTTLPKEFQLARFSRPKDGHITITTANNLLVKDIKLPNKNNILIYVKIATPYAKASVSVIPF